MNRVRPGSRPTSASRLRPQLGWRLRGEEIESFLLQFVRLFLGFIRLENCFPSPLVLVLLPDKLLPLGYLLLPPPEALDGEDFAESLNL